MTALEAGDVSGPAPAYRATAERRPSAPMTRSVLTSRCAAQKSAWCAAVHRTPHLTNDRRPAGDGSRFPDQTVPPVAGGEGCAWVPVGEPLRRGGRARNGGHHADRDRTR